MMNRYRVITAGTITELEELVNASGGVPVGGIAVTQVETANMMQGRIVEYTFYHSIMVKVEDKDADDHGQTWTDKASGPEEPATKTTHPLPGTVPPSNDGVAVIQGQNRTKTAQKQQKRGK